MKLIVKQSNIQEQVSSELIDKLYQITSGGVLTNDSELQGSLVTQATYEDAVVYLREHFPNLIITANTYYIRFADLEAERVVKSALGKGQNEGVLSSELSSFRPSFRDNTVVKHFDEMKYCSPNVDEYAFKGCTNLKSIDLTNITSMSGNGHYFFGCINLEYFHGINGERGVLNLTNLTNASFTNWFYNCKKLERITSLGFISNISWGAFAGCSALESVTGISNVTSIGTSAFENCSSLSTITLQNITSIGEKAFNACSNLEYCDGPNSTQGELNLPNLTGTLGNSAFKGCVKLTSIASLGSITSIAGGAFENCTSLATITFPGTIDSVGENAFNNTPWYNSQNNTVIYIDNVLYKCKGTIPSSLVIPNNVVSITDGAFRSITSLESLTIGSGVNSIGVGEAIFYGCTNLATIVVDFNNAKYNSGNGGNAIIETATNTLVAGCKGTSIPNSVTKIASRAFGNNKGITSINLNNVSEIGDYAFAGDSNLITVSQGNLTKLTEGAFNGCSSLQTIDISSVTSIGAGAFRGCTNLTVDISTLTSLQNIGQWAFDVGNITGVYDSGIGATINLGSHPFGKNLQNAELILRTNVTGLGRGYMSELHTPKITLGMTTIPNDCFYGLNQRDSTPCELILLNTVNIIQQKAFQHSQLKSPCIIPSSVTSVGSYSFGLESTQCEIKFESSTPPLFAQRVFTKDGQNEIRIGKILVPSGSKQAYLDALHVNNQGTGWTDNLVEEYT